VGVGKCGSARSTPIDDSALDVDEVPGAEEAFIRLAC
jgi:hypothetical protein